MKPSTSIVEGAQMFRSTAQMEILQLECYSVKLKCGKDVAHNAYLLHYIFRKINIELGVIQLGAKGPKINYGAEFIEN